MFKLLLALMFCVNLNYVAQADTEERQLVQMSRQLLQANTTAASGTGDDDGTDDDGTDDDGDDDGTDDDGADDDGTDDDGSGTDVDDGSDADGDDTDTDNTDTDADDGDDADTDADDEDDDDDADADSADTDASGSDSNDDGDTNSSDTNSSDDDSDGDSDDSDDSDSDDSGDSDSDSSDDTNSDTNADTNTNSGTNTFIDPCDGLEGTACTENYDADGNPNCAQNVNTADCYSIVQSQGLYGSGNFDEGYRAAQQSTEGETESLNAVVGVLGAFVAVLALTVGGGGYWMYRRNQKETQYRHESIAMETMHEAGGANGVALPMIEETV